jgi:hypothetical protein
MPSETVGEAAGRALRARAGRLFAFLTILSFAPAFARARAAQARPETTSVPLGGIGTGYVELRSDGHFTNAAINNNLARPLGPLRGTFAAVWTRAGGQAQARSLRAADPYGLPSAANTAFSARYPQAFLTSTDPALPVSIRLRAYSTVIPHDLKNSNLPAFVVVCTIKNEARAKVEAAVAIAWENIAGLGGSLSKGAFGSRTGNTVAPLPAMEGVFGLRMASPLAPAADPEHQLVYNAEANYALLAEASTPETRVTTAGWNAKADRPAWWSEFAASGTVSGEVAAGREGLVHPAGVVAVKVSLDDGEQMDIPFVVAWYTPRHYTLGGEEVGHLYQKVFDDSVEVARYTLANRLNLLTLTEEWQNKVLRSTLPPALAERLLNDASTLTTRTVLTRDSGLGGEKPGPPLFALLHGPAESSDVGALRGRMLDGALLALWFPALNVQELRRISQLQTPAGALPRAAGDYERSFTKPADPGSAPDAEQPELAASLVFQVAATYRWTGDRPFLDRFYPAAKRSVQYLLELDKDADGLPDLGEALTPDARARWTATLRILADLAGAMDDRRFAAELTGRLAGALKTVAAQGTAGVTAAGPWMAAFLGHPDLFPPPFRDLPPQQDGDSVTAAALQAIGGRPDTAATMLTGGGKSEARPGAWLAFLSLLGVQVDLTADRLTLAPALTTGSRSLYAPLFMPTFWATLDYRVAVGGYRLSLRVDRMMPAKSILLEPRPATTPEKKPDPAAETEAQLTLREVVLPPPGSDRPEVTVSVGRAPVPAKSSRDGRGRLVVTFEPPVTLRTGQRLEFIVR